MIFKAEVTIKVKGKGKNKRDFIKNLREEFSHRIKNISIKESKITEEDRERRRDRMTIISYPTEYKKGAEAMYSYKTSDGKDHNIEFYVHRNMKTLNSYYFRVECDSYPWNDFYGKEFIEFKDAVKFGNKYIKKMKKKYKTLKKWD